MVVKLDLFRKGAVCKGRVDQNRKSHYLGFMQAYNKAICVARNYAAHAAELNNPIPSEPVFFIKPASAICPFAQPIQLPVGLGDCHYELELVAFVAKPIRHASPAEALKRLAGWGLGLDLTLRELQNKLKAAGHPWEMAKAFDSSLPLSPLLPLTAVNPLDCLLELKINGQTRQKESTKMLLTPVAELLSWASRFFTLEAGDVLLTGTPQGVGPLHSGDKLEASLDGKFIFTTEVA